MKRTALYLIAVLVGVVGLGAVWTWYTWSHPSPLPRPTGPHAVGRVEFDWRDAERADPFVPSAQRELDAVVWYPAAHAGTKRAEYVRAAWIRAQQRPFPMPKVEGVSTHSWSDAPLASAEGERWPVVIFTPGFGALPSDYTALAEELASYGYVVASPANTYSGITVVFPDGHVASEIAEQPDNDRLAHIWAEDVASVWKRLRALDADPASMFFRKLELTRIGVMGHSFGGVAAAQFCMAEPACAAGMDLDGALAGDAPKRGIRAPFVFMVSDGTTSYWSSKAATAEWDSVYAKYLASVRATCARSPQCTVEVEQGFRHANFTDSAALFRPPLVWAHPALGSADPREGVTRLRQQVTSFLDHWVKEK